TGSVEVKLGRMSLTSQGGGRLLEGDPEQGRVELEGSGTDRRGNGDAGAPAAALLRAGGAGAGVDVHAGLAVGGQPAQRGRGMIQSVSNKMLDKFLGCIRQKMGAEPAS